MKLSVLVLGSWLIAAAPLWAGQVPPHLLADPPDEPKSSYHGDPNDYEDSTDESEAARDVGNLAPDEIPVSLDRIQRRLATAPRSARDGLRLDYYIEVYGRAPRIDLFANFDPTTGPVPYGPPTHAEMLWIVTPEEFRSPAADFSTPLIALFKWLAGHKK